MIGEPYVPDLHGSVSIGVLHARMIKCIGIEERDGEAALRGVSACRTRGRRELELHSGREGHDRQPHGRAPPGSAAGVSDGACGLLFPIPTALRAAGVELGLEVVCTHRAATSPAATPAADWTDQTAAEDHEAGFEERSTHQQRARTDPIRYRSWVQRPARESVPLWPTDPSGPRNCTSPRSGRRHSSGGPRRSVSVDAHRALFTIQEPHGESDMVDRSRVHLRVLPATLLSLPCQIPSSASERLDSSAVDVELDLIGINLRDELTVRLTLRKSVLALCLAEPRRARIRWLGLCQQSERCKQQRQQRSSYTPDCQT
jgi:hypothetical protein